MFCFATPPEGKYEPKDDVSNVSHGLDSCRAVRLTDGFSCRRIAPVALLFRGLFHSRRWYNQKVDDNWGRFIFSSFAKEKEEFTTERYKFFAFCWKHDQKRGFFNTCLMATRKRMPHPHALMGKMVTKMFSLKYRRFRDDLCHFGTWNWKAILMKLNVLQVMAEQCWKSFTIICSLPERWAMTAVTCLDLQMQKQNFCQPLRKGHSKCRTRTGLRMQIVWKLINGIDEQVSPKDSEHTKLICISWIHWIPLTLMVLTFVVSLETLQCIFANFLYICVLWMQSVCLQ